MRADPGDIAKNKDKLQLAKCYALGPFNVGPNVERAISKLKEYGIAGNKRKEEIRERMRHWVLEPTKNKKAALRRVRELRNKKIKDVYIIRKGDKKNKISLGFFRNGVAAQKRVKELKRLGFRPIVEKSYRIRAIFWLDVAIAEDVEFTDKQWEEVTDGFDGILRKEQPCP